MAAQRLCRQRGSLVRDDIFLIPKYLVYQLKFRYLSRVSLKITGNRGKVFILELELRLLVQKGIDSVGLTG